MQKRLLTRAKSKNRLLMDMAESLLSIRVYNQILYETATLIPEGATKDTIDNYCNILFNKIDEELRKGDISETKRLSYIEYKLYTQVSEWFHEDKISFSAEELHNELFDNNSTISVNDVINVLDVLIDKTPISNHMKEKGIHRIPYKKVTGGNKDASQSKYIINTLLGPFDI